MLILSQEAGLLSKVPRFSKLELLAFTSDCYRCEPEEELFHTGDPSDCGYVIMSGEGEIVVLTEKGEELQNKL